MHGTLKWLIEMSDGDGKNALNSHELAVQSVQAIDSSSTSLNLSIDELNVGIKRSLYDRRGSSLRYYKCLTQVDTC